MACTSGSVKTVAEKNVAAAKAIEKVQAMLEAQENVNKTKFFSNIDAHLTDANVADARQISYNSAIKTEYTSEFSLDEIAAVVTTAVKAAVAATNPAVPTAAASPAALNAYADVVNAVAEAAKSKSTAAANISFSMNRLFPGIFVFLYATSVNIEDDDTFGTEGVTSTAIYYRFMESIDDVQNTTKHGAAFIDAKNLLNMKKLQAALTDELASGEITIDEWTKKDAAYSKAVKTIQDRLDAHKFDSKTDLVLEAMDGFGAPVQHSFTTGSVESQEIVRTAIQKLSEKGELYKDVIETSRARLASHYY